MCFVVLASLGEAMYSSSIYTSKHVCIVDLLLTAHITWSGTHSESMSIKQESQVHIHFER